VVKSHSKLFIKEEAMVEYDHDDPPPPVRARAKQFWYVFIITLPANLFWLVVYVVAFTWLVPLLKGG